MQGLPDLSRRTLIRSAALIGAGTLLPARATAASSAAAAFESGWPKVTGLVSRYVAERKVPGMLAALGWGDGPLGAIARGIEGFDDRDPVSLDSLFRLYSMTKPITGIAAMMLIDEGKLGLDQPVADFVPEFGRMRVAIDPAKSLASRPANTVMTIRHLLTHTAGLGYAGSGNDRVSMEMLRTGVAPAVVSRYAFPPLTPPVPTPGPDEFLRRTAQVPLLFEPGTRWSYSVAYDVLGLVIERASRAKNFAAFLQERIFDPAGMRNSFFQLPPSGESKLTTNYGVLAGIAIAIDRPKNSAFLDPPPFAYGGAGLVSTPADYDRFLMLLVNRGKVDRRQVISEKALAMGLSNLLPEGAITRGTMVDGAGFGAGGRVGLGADEGSFGWSGAAGTVGFVNRRIGLRAGLYVQYMPITVYPVQREFIAATRDDVLGRRSR